MKVSKKCVRKMKNRRILHGKIGRIWLLAFFVSAFLCSFLFGTSVSALNGTITAQNLSFRSGSSTINVSIPNSDRLQRVTFNVDGVTGSDLSYFYVDRIGMDFSPNPGATTLKKGQKFILQYQIFVPYPARVLTPSVAPLGNTVVFEKVERDMSISNSFSKPSGQDPDYAPDTDIWLTYTIYGYINTDSWDGVLTLAGFLYSNTATSSNQKYIDITQPSMLLYNSSETDAVAEQNEEERNQTEQQVTDGNNSANSSSSDASTQGSTLLSAFQSFIGALTSASPSNCNLDMDLGNLDLGNANLCSISPPPAFQVISSIVLIGFCVPLSIATAKKLISLFRSFQS